MIVQDLNNLPRFGDHDVVICDCETTSWDDAQMALRPFNGHRVAGYALSTEDGKQTWYLPVRHHGPEQTFFHQNLPLANVQRYLQDLFACPTRTFANHNAKFDARFMYFDGVKFLGGFQDTMVLGRLVYGQRDKRWGGRGYGLDAMAEDFLNARKMTTVAAYCKSLGTKDYGRVPIALMSEYAEQDARLAARLRLHLLKHLPAVSNTIWAIEQRVSKVLLDAEIFGIPLRVPRLKAAYAKLLRRLISLLDRVETVAGREVNVASSDDLHEFLNGQLGIAPTAWTETGKPSWSALNLSILAVPPGLPPDLGIILSEASRLSHLTSNYCQGWLEAMGDDGRLHTDFRQWGTCTGRLSSSGPNVQNFDDIAEAWIEEDEGRVLMYYDLSQAEYRVFGHYTGAEMLVKAYTENIDTDFHGWLAEMLGVSRQFAKTMNFSFIYGMGKKKLLEALSAVLALSLQRGDERLNNTMHTLLSSSSSVRAGVHLFSSPEMAAASEIVYNKYHRVLPEIRKFQQRVSNLIRVRGWLRDYYGRVYRLPSQRSYVGVNYVIQGTVGDYMKERSAALFEQTHDRDAHMVNEIHDASVWSVPREHALEFHQRAMRTLEDSPFKIPMRADCKVTAASWSQLQKLPRDATEATLESTLVASRAAPIMTWEEREGRKQAGTSTKGRGT